MFQFLFSDLLYIHKADIKIEHNTRLMAKYMLFLILCLLLLPSIAVYASTSIFFLSFFVYSSVAADYKYVAIQHQFQHLCVFLYFIIFSFVEITCCRDLEICTHFYFYVFYDFFSSFILPILPHYFDVHSLNIHTLHVTSNT